MTFLTNRPPIKEVRFELSSNRFRPGDTNQPAFVPLRASLQSGGFFWEFPTAFPNVMPCVYGESPEVYWTVDTNVVSLASKTGPGAHPQNGAQILGERYRRRLQTLLMFGLEDAEPDSVIWLSPTRLEAQSLPTPDKRRVRLTGELSLDSEGRPSGLEYLDADRGSLQGRVRYRYEERGAVLPKVIVVSREGNSSTRQRGQQVLTNVIVRLETGALPTGSQGFTPSLFVREDDRHRSLLVNSNAARYRITELGMIRDEGGPDPPVWALAAQPIGVARYVWLAVTVGAASGFVWWLGRRRK